MNLVLHMNAGAPYVVVEEDDGTERATFTLEHDPGEPLLERKESWRWRVALTDGGGGSGPL